MTMLSERGRMAGDRARGRPPLAVGWWGSRGAERAVVVAGRAVFLAGAFGIGWLVASHVDPRGDVLRYSLGWLVGEFR